MGIYLVDDFIVSGSDYLSMARGGFYDPKGVFYVKKEKGDTGKGYFKR